MAVANFNGPVYFSGTNLFNSYFVLYLGYFFTEKESSQCLLRKNMRAYGDDGRDQQGTREERYAQLTYVWDLFVRLTRSWLASHAFALHVLDLTHICSPETFFTWLACVHLTRYWLDPHVFAWHVLNLTHICVQLTHFWLDSHVFAIHVLDMTQCMQ